MLICTKNLYISSLRNPFWLSIIVIVHRNRFDATGTQLNKHIYTIVQKRFLIQKDTDKDRHQNFVGHCHKKKNKINKNM